MPATRSSTFRKELASAIVERLEQMELKQADASEAAGLPRARISALQHGRTDLISLDKLVDAAENLGLTVRISVTRPWVRAR